MTTIKITSKRQATLPKALCDDMQVQPGDSLVVERRQIENEDAWVIRPVPRLSDSDFCGLTWIGSLKRYAIGKLHDMASVRRSIEEARRGEKR
ncbi:MAG: AbrB/MazE/SpoVT family DNA-binding domain-containing protein [Pirellulales bacterium]|nr:AbrB/MazE/SpoVT family DNA-binding domain-containing protein [Pirellulales bacterium]